MQNEEEISRLINTVQTLLDEAKKQGATAAEAGLSQENGLSVSARLGDVETIEHHCGQGLGITVYFGQCKGSASSTDLSQDSIRETVRAACSIARYTSEDAYAGLPEKELLATEFPDLDLNHPWGVSVDDAIALAIECEDAARDVSSGNQQFRRRVVNTHQGIRVMGNSLGFLHGFIVDPPLIELFGTGAAWSSMQRDYWYTVA